MYPVCVASEHSVPFFLLLLLLTTNAEVQECSENPLAVLHT